MPASARASPSARPAAAPAKGAPAVPTRRHADAGQEALEAEAERIASRILRGDRDASPPSGPLPGPLPGHHAGASPSPRPSWPEPLAPGQPLDQVTRRLMEARLGHDLAPVRVHADDAAAAAARALGALAFASGRDIFLSATAPRPPAAAGRALLAHELVHVVQQARGAPFPVQCKPDPAAPAVRAIVTIIAFRHSTRDAIAILSDGSAEAVTLRKNTLDPGEYTFERDQSRLHYRKTGGDPGQDFVWLKPRSYRWAETVKVVIRLSPEEKVAALPGYIRAYLTTTRSGAERASRQDLENIATAGRILTLYGVTEDELTLRELAEADAEGVGRRVERTDDVVGWALTFVEGREAARASARGTRLTLLENAEALMAVAVRGSPSWRGNAAAAPFMRALDAEVAAMAAALLNAVEAALFRTDKRFIGAWQGKAYGPGFVWDALAPLRNDREIAHVRALLRKEESWRPPDPPRDEEAYEKEIRNYGPAHWQEPWYSPVHRQRHEIRLRGYRADLVRLIEEKSRARGPGGDSAGGLEIGALRTADAEGLLAAKSPSKAYLALRDILFQGRRAVRDARRYLGDTRALYGADIVIRCEKAALGAAPGSMLAWLIDEVAKERTKRRIWEKILTIAGFVLAFIPGPIGLILRTALATFESVRAVESNAEQATLNQASLASAGPEGGLGLSLVVTAAGVAFDVATTRLPVREPPRAGLIPPGSGEAPLPTAAPADMRGIPRGQGVEIRAAAVPGPLTRADAALLRDTEASLLARREGLLRERARAQQLSDGLAGEIQRRQDLLEAETLNEAGLSRVRRALAGLEQRWSAEQAELARIEAALGPLDAELGHVRGQLRSTATSEQIFAELDRELEAVPAGPARPGPGRGGPGRGGFESPRPLPETAGAAEIRTPGGAAVRESAGATTRPGAARLASAADSAAIPTAIRADVAEASAYKWALERGEIGLQRPSGANVAGGDFITAVDGPGGAEIIVTDAKSSAIADFPRPAGPDVPPKWMAEVRAAVSRGRLDLGDRALEARIRAAVDAVPPRVRLRQLNVDYSPSGGGRIVDPTAP